MNGLMTNGTMATSVNTDTKALSFYLNYPFNSLADRGRGVYLGANANGIFVLDGPDDAGTPISAWVRSAPVDNGNANLRRVPTAYVGLLSDGDLMVSINIGDGVEHGGALASTAGQRVTRRVNLALGVDGRYTDLKIANINGEYFEIESISAATETFKRRIR